MSKILALIAVVAVVAVAGTGVYVLVDSPGGNVEYNYAESSDPVVLPAPPTGSEYLLVDVTVKNIDYSDEDDGYEMDPDNFKSIRGSDGKTYWYKEDLTERHNNVSGYGYPDEIYKGQSASFSIIYMVPVGVTLSELNITDDDNDRVSYKFNGSLPL